MKTIETKPCSFKELSADAQSRVIERERKGIQSDPDDFTLGECMDSLKAIAAALGVKLTNWNIGPYNRDNKCSCSSDESGNKSIARFARALQSKGYTVPARFKAMTFPRVCGFTGLCFDEDICEAMWEALLQGESLSKAFDRAADRIQTICEDDLEYRQKDESILENLDQSAEIYTDCGSVF